MTKGSLAEIAKWLGGELIHQDADFNGVSIDSRTLSSGELFVAIEGERFNGHDFVEDIAKRGAAGAVVSQRMATALPYVLVSDTQKALAQIALGHREKVQIPVVGITGSCGKTTVKEMVKAILSLAYDEVLATEGNFNNEIGVPLTLLRLNSQHQAAVIEMGASKQGDIQYLCQWVKPSVAILTNAAAAHLESFKNLDTIAQTKGEIFAGLSEHGTAIVNRDDAYFPLWAKIIASRKMITFGRSDEAMVTAKDISVQTPGRTSFTLVTREGQWPITLNLPGEHNVMNALSAAAAALALNLSVEAIQQGLATLASRNGRMHIMPLSDHLQVIDDTYNANEFSVKAAIHALARFKGMRILVLGDLAECGEDEALIHHRLGCAAKAQGIDRLLTLGKASHATTQAFGKGAQHFEAIDDLVQALAPYLDPASQVTILVKGSRSAQMERVVEALANKKESSDATLVN